MVHRTHNIAVKIKIIRSYCPKTCQAGLSTGTLETIADFLTLTRLLSAMATVFFFLLPLGALLLFLFFNLAVVVMVSPSRCSADTRATDIVAIEELSSQPALAPTSSTSPISTFSRPVVSPVALGVKSFSPEAFDVPGVEGLADEHGAFNCGDAKRLFNRVTMLGETFDGILAEVAAVAGGCRNATTNSPRLRTADPHDDKGLHLYPSVW